MNDEEMWKLSDTMRIFVEGFIDPRRAALEDVKVSEVAPEVLPLPASPAPFPEETLNKQISENKSASIDYVIGNLKKLAYEVDAYNNERASYLVEMAISALEDIKEEDLE